MKGYIFPRLSLQKLRECQRPKETLQVLINHLSLLPTSSPQLTFVSHISLRANSHLFSFQVISCLTLLSIFSEMP